MTVIIFYIATADVLLLLYFRYKILIWNIEIRWNHHTLGTKVETKFKKFLHKDMQMCSRAYDIQSIWIISKFFQRKNSRFRYWIQKSFPKIQKNFRKIQILVAFIWNFGDFKNEKKLWIWEFFCAKIKNKCDEE